MATRNDTTVSTKEALAAWDSVYNAREELNRLFPTLTSTNPRAAYRLKHSAT